MAQKPMTPITPHTVSDVQKLKKLLERARERGYDTQRNETTAGLGTIAVPIFGPSQKVIGALSLAFPEPAVPLEEEDRYAEALHRRARQISLRMGSIVYSVGAQS